MAAGRMRKDVGLVRIEWSKVERFEYLGGEISWSID